MTQQKKEVLFLVDFSQGFPQTLLLFGRFGEDVWRFPEVIADPYESIRMVNSYMHAIFGVEKMVLPARIGEDEEAVYWALDVTRIPLNLQDDSGIALTAWRMIDEIPLEIDRKYKTYLKLALERKGERK